MPTSNVGHIAYIGSFDFPDRNAAANLAIATADVFENNGYEVVIVGRTTSDDISEVLAANNGVRIVLSSRKHGWRRKIHLWKSWTDCRKVLDEKNNWSIVVLYNMRVALMLPIMFWARRRNIPTVAHCTEWYARVPWKRNPVSAVIRNVDTFIRMKILNKFVDGLLVASQYLASYYSTKPLLVYPTLSANVVRGDTISRGAVPVLVYAGVPFRPGERNLNERQMKDRIDVIIKLLARVPVRFRFDIYGISREDYVKALPAHRSLVEELNNKIAFHGRVPSQRVGSAIRDADFTILVRDANRVTLAGFPTKFTESLLHGTPVLANMVGDISQYLIDGENGFLLPEAADEAVGILTEALSLTPEQRLALKERTEMTTTHLTPPAWTEAMGEFLRKVQLSNCDTR